MKLTAADEKKIAVLMKESGEMRPELATASRTSSAPELRGPLSTRPERARD
jgi:hypothetical protein